MKQNLLLLSIATSIFALFVCYAHFSSKTTVTPGRSRPDLVKTAGAATSNIPAGFSKTIAAREYHISFDRTRKILQSPNRKHNLRATYRPGLFTVQNRVDSSGPAFSLTLQHEGILADGRLIDQADPAAKTEILENKLLIRHSKFTEEFINNEEGIRQNFIVQQAPEGTNQLEVVLSAKGLRIQNGAKNELLFFAKDEKMHPRLVYRDLQCWDAQNRPLTACMTGRGQEIHITVDVHAASYPVTIDPIISNGNPGNTDTYLESDQANALLGFSVASAGDVNGDGYSDVLAGAPHFDNGQPDEGAAFLYLGSANGVGAVPQILEGNQAGAAMGYSVSSAGDVNADGFSDIAIGSPFYSKGQNGEGVVFVHLGSPNGIKPNPVAILEGNQFEAQFGISVALAGDVNGDGFSDLLAGANQFDQGQINEGAAFIYYGSQLGIAANKVTLLQSNQANAMLGSSVAAAGDVNADGYGDVLAGTPFYDQGQTEEGGAFIYLGSPQGPVDPPVIIEGNQAFANLGSAVSCAGDVNGDGYSDIMVSAPHYDKLQKDIGLVNIYFGSNMGIDANSFIQLAGSEMEENFGLSVACAGDINGDGYADVMVGSRFQGKGPAGEGIVKIYQGFQLGINKKPVSTIKGGQANALLGQSIASGGDVNGDGYSDIVIGAHVYDHGQADEGIVLIWHGAPGGPITNRTALSCNPPESAFGYSVSGAGDVDGDGYGDIIVGAPHYDNGQSEEGAAFLFKGTPNGIGQIPSNILEADQADAGFGTSVSSAGDVNGDGFGDIIVGAMHYDDGENEEGAAFVYFGSSSGIGPVPVQLESNKTGAWFGCAVAHAGDLNDDGFSEVVIGAMNYSNGQSEEGALYVFPGSPNGPNVAALRTIESDQEDARLGNAVSFAGDLNGDGHDDIVAGAYGVGEYDAGAIFIGYGKSNSLDSLTMDCIKGTQDQAHFGWDVSGAGDVNGDGFHDVIVGANAYDNGDGAAHIYYGSTVGVTPANVTDLYSHETGMAAAMGQSVAGAGDLNSDGYADVIVGEPWFIDENSSILTGLAMVYFGSPAGPDPGPQRIKGSPSDVYDFFGWSVAAAGDVNADGYSDMVIGSPNFGSDQTDADAAFVYYGNNARGLRSDIRLYNSDLTTLLNYQQHSKNDFSIGLFSRSFLGLNKGKLAWEAVGSGQSFSTGPNGRLANSTSYSGIQKTYHMLNGTELKYKINKQGASTYLRARIKYNPTLALTGQIYGPWRYLSGVSAGTTSAPAPLMLTSELAVTSVATTYVYPNPASSMLQIHSGKGRGISEITLVTIDGLVVKVWKDGFERLDLRGIRPGRYLLQIHYVNASESSHSIVLH